MTSFADEIRWARFFLQVKEVRSVYVKSDSPALVAYSYSTTTVVEGVFTMIPSQHAAGWQEREVQQVKDEFRAGLTWFHLPITEPVLVKVRYTDGKPPKPRLFLPVRPGEDPDKDVVARNTTLKMEKYPYIKRAQLAAPWLTWQEASKLVDFVPLPLVMYLADLVADLPMRELRSLAFQDPERLEELLPGPLKHLAAGKKDRDKLLAGVTYCLERAKRI